MDDRHSGVKRRLCARQRTCCIALHDDSCRLHLGEITRQQRHQLANNVSRRLAGPHDVEVVLGQQPERCERVGQQLAVLPSRHQQCRLT